MLKYPCLVLDHDDTVVQSEAMVNYPYFSHILDQFRPGAAISLSQYAAGCCQLGFADMCRLWFGFSEQELVNEYLGWQEYIKTHVPDPYPGIASVIRRQKAEGGLICVVSHSCDMNITRDYQTHFGILPDDIYGWDLPEDKRKPSTYPLECIMEKYRLTPRELLVVDDMKLAHLMASRAGVPIAFAAWGRADYPEIMAEMTACCDFTFHTPAELEAFLFD
ncbi:MAG: HAD hydrolase-like protein [Eubacteriales bacterium]|nr:HAD hydrolase-like protein [Eubacteriales bacterium]